MNNELQIRIRTILEGQGIKVTDESLKSLARSASEADRATASTGKAVREASESINQFGRKGSEAKDAFEGLTQVARGGEGAIFGMAKAWRALTAAFAANPITAVLALILGLLPLIKKGFDLIGESAQKSLDRMAGTGEQVRAVEANIKELATTSEKYLAGMNQQARELATSYASLNAEIDGSLRRFKEVEGARLKAESSKLELERQTALAGAKTPEDVARINTQFDARIASSQGSSAKRVGDAELTSITQRGIAADQAKETAQRAISDAEARVEAARRAESSATGSLSRGNALRARQRAEADLTAVREKFGPQLAKAENDIKDVAAATEAFGYIEQAGRFSTKSSGIKSVLETASSTGGRDRIRQLEGAARTAFERGDNAAQDNAVAELRRLRAAEALKDKAIKEYAAGATALAQATTQELEKRTRALKNTKESRSGQ